MTLSKAEISRQVLATYEPIFLLRRLAGHRGELAFVPGFRRHFPRSAIYKICRELGWAIFAGNYDHAGLKIYWPPGERAEANPRPNMINGRCINIDKSHVEKLFAETFGYGYAVDPRTHEGSYVKKSNMNALHDGRILTEPSKPEAGFVYNRLIENAADDMAEDIRIVYMREVLPFFYLKKRPLAARFSNVNASVSIERTADYISPSETDSIHRLCQAIGLDYGDLDCLRDRSNGRLYVVDVNRTPWGPPVELPTDASRKAVRDMATFFAKAFSATS